MKTSTFASIVALLLVLSFAGAQAKDAPIPSPPPYSAVGLEMYAHSGTCQLIGRAVVETKTFGPLTFAGQKVHLLPFTEYNLWSVKRLADMSDLTRRPYPDELVPLNREQTTDSNGNFSFDHIACGSYLVEMFTDYESDSHSIENRTIYSTNDDEFPTSVTTQRIRTKLRRELDVVAATSFFTRENEQISVYKWSLLGFQQCCAGEL
jgi:hypothetical protein